MCKLMIGYLDIYEHLVVNNVKCKTLNCYINSFINSADASCSALQIYSSLVIKMSF